MKYRQNLEKQRDGERRSSRGQRSKNRQKDEKALGVLRVKGGRLIEEDISAGTGNLHCNFTNCWRLSADSLRVKRHQANSVTVSTVSFTSRNIPDSHSKYRRKIPPGFLLEEG